MKFTLGWLQEWIDLKNPSADFVANTLTQIGVEVGNVQQIGGLPHSVVVAKILERQKHPDADRLSLCKVDDGHGIHNIVCGAQNMQAGDFVVLAREGSLLPNGLTIKRSKIRGVESEGMLCSAEELGLIERAKHDSSINVDGIVLLSRKAPLGVAAASCLKMGDAVIELEITANRGDLFSVLGVAREPAAATAGSLKADAFPKPLAKDVAWVKKPNKPAASR